uniref:Uncharacterized protein n=1 Tax=Avena sativa TaxID=4498 RepID=A0ACD5ZHC2_AVESA
MTSASTTLHLAAPLLFLLLLLAAASASTLAVAGGSTVCGVAADNGTVYCVDLASNASSSSSASPVAPSLVFSRVSGGAGFVCGLSAGNNESVLLCWPPGPDASASLRRVYRGAAQFSDLAVGDDHVAAYDAQAQGIRWWRGSGQFPLLVPGAFRSLASGDGFTCAVETNSSSPSKVRCWGPSSSAIQTAFANATVSSLAAGASRACGVDSLTGAVLCSGQSGAGALAQSNLYPHGLAVGDSHACGLRKPNHTAVCWTLSGPTPTVYYPAPDTAFEFLVAGGNLTCGLVTYNYTVLCWSTSEDNAAVEVPLPTLLPGTCVADESLCECGVFPGSGELCAVAGSPGSGICNRVCVTSPPPSPPASPTPAASKGVSRGWIAFAVVGAVGAFIGLCSIVYCFVFGFCSHKRIHNSVQPNLPGAAGGGAGNAPAAAADSVGGSVAASPYGSPNGSRARGFLFRRQLSRAMTRQRSGPSSFKEQTEEYTFAQLAAATDGFAPEAKIGAGSFGTVYRGKLSDGREVAIKRGESSGPMARKFQEKESAFRSELAFLSRLHHKHLVGLVGYCEENEERLLVYEYMKNGALYDYLHPKANVGDESPSPVLSSWKLRIKILLDASRGIEYLHSYAVPPIIHRDIKSSNILLDGGWTARVSDFGLSLMGPPESSDDSSSLSGVQQQQPQHLSMKAAGTVGYMDPEYYGMHHLTVKSDVYGFGVVMLETLTGKRAIFKEAEGGEPVSVVDYAQPSVVAGELRKVLDGRAPEPTPNEAEAVELVAYTAVHCVRLEGKDRPAMADIVANLETAFAFCEGSAGGNGGGGRVTSGFRNSSSSLSMTSMELSGRIGD